MNEELEEAAERLYPISGPNSMWNSLQQDGFIEGAKWQQQKMYSEKDMIMKFLDTEIKLGLSDIKTIERVKWYLETYFEQFKKK